jgi:ribonucleotide reductase beta subunit family protein with ferritin-like domain
MSDTKDLKKLQCTNLFCVFETASSVDLKSHIESCDLKTQVCSICQKPVPVSILTKHLRSHPNSTDADEPLLQPCSTEDQYVLFPIRHKEIWELYKNMEANVWTAAEVSKYIHEDKKHFKEKLSKDEQHYISLVIAFFAQSDAIVIENLAERFRREVQWEEAKYFYGLQIANEQVHAETYAILSDELIEDPVQKKKMFQAIQHFPAIKKKAEWCQKYIFGSNRFAERLIAFAIVEGVFFSSSFAAIFYLKKRNGIMPGLIHSNNLISKDEGTHTEFAVLLYKYIKHRLTQAEVTQIIREAVLIESEFVQSCLPVKLIGMDSASMIQYVQFVADRLLTSVGYEKTFKVTNPFDWMDLISVDSKANFFERGVQAYQKPGVMASLKEKPVNEQDWKDAFSGFD